MSAGAPDDLILLPSSRTLGADPHDFAGLFIRHRWAFQLHARRFLSDQRDIDEVVQEGFLKLFLALPELETELQALAYARRTITNLCIDRYRAAQRRPRLIDLDSLPIEPAMDEDECDPVIQAENAALVREALAMLSPLHREALIKREIEEKPLPQIAAELDIPVEQVKHVLHRARRSLRRLLVGTHVEPGVDLDLAIVLAANRERAARLAKPVGASMMALLLLLASVLGLRAALPAPQPTEMALPSTPSLGLPTLPRPVAPAAPAAPSALPPVPGSPIAAPVVAPAEQVAKPVQQTLATPRQGGLLRSRPAVRALAATLPRSATPKEPGVTPVVGGGAGQQLAPPVIPAPVAPVAPLAAPDYRFSGNLRAAGPVEISEPTVVLSPTGTSVLSTVTVPLDEGMLVIDQRLWETPVGPRASLRAHIDQGPTSETLIPRLTTVSIAPVGDGTVIVDLEMTSAATAIVASSDGVDQSVGGVHTRITYAADRSIISEVITTHAGLAPTLGTPPTAAEGRPIASSSSSTSDRRALPSSRETEGRP